MEIAVTGASGNVGSAVLRRFRADGSGRAEHGLLGIARRAPRSSPGSAAAEWLTTDISDAGQLPALTEALRGRDAVIHLAWKIQPSHHEDELYRTNVDGSRNVFRAAVEAGVKHVVVASSVGTYSAGPKDQLVDETWPAEGIPTSSYSRHKAEVERMLDDLQRDQPDLTVTRLRPGLVFQGTAASEIGRLFLGPLVPRGLLGRLKLPVLPIPGALTFQAVHADDLAEAYWMVTRGGIGGAFNVAADPVLTPDELARALGARRALRVPVPPLRWVASATWHAHLQPTDAGWIDLAAGVPLMSTARLRNLGWTPRHTSVQALGELVTGLRARSGDQAYAPLVSRGRRA